MLEPYPKCCHMTSNPSDSHGSISCSVHGPNPCLVQSLVGPNLSTSLTSHFSSPRGPYEGKRRLLQMAASLLMLLLVIFTFRGGKARDRSLPFQRQVFSWGAGRASVVWRENGKVLIGKIEDWKPVQDCPWARSRTLHSPLWPTPTAKQDTPYTQ